MGILRLPDGAAIRVPDGATAEQVSAILAERKWQGQIQQSREAARDTYRHASTGERFWTGVSRPFVETGLGLKDIGGKMGIGSGLSDEDKLNVERLQEVTGGAGTAGRITGELMNFALPGGIVGRAGTKLVQAAPR